MDYYIIHLHMHGSVMSISVTELDLNYIMDIIKEDRPNGKSRFYWSKDNNGLFLGFVTGAVNGFTVEKRSNKQLTSYELDCIYKKEVVEALGAQKKFLERMNKDLGEEESWKD